MSWSLWITSQDTWWHLWPKIRKQKLLHEFSMSDSSQCLACQLNCSVTKVHELHLCTSWKALFSIWHSKMQDYCIPCAMQWTGGKNSSNFVQNDQKVGGTLIRRLSGNNISLNFCRPTTVPDLQSRGTHPTTSCLGGDPISLWTFLPHDWC